LNISLIEFCAYATAIGGGNGEAVQGNGAQEAENWWKNRYFKLII